MKLAAVWASSRACRKPYEMAAERTVRESGVDWTILRPDWFNQNFDEGVLREAVLAGEVALPVGEARQVFVDAEDIAAAAAAALSMAMRSLAQDLREDGILAVVISPGWVKTDMGGPEAPLSVTESTTGLVALLDRLTPQDSGGFFDYRGEPLAW